MKRLICILVFSLPASASIAQKTVWKSDDISRMEIETFYELFSLIPGWNNATNNDVAIQYSRNGLAGPGGAWWPIYMNGVKLNQQLWNTQGLFFAPVNFNQVDSIVVVQEPMVYHSEFTEKGGIFIYTKYPNLGLNVQAGMTYGNQSGDPGPFVFTELGSPNVERTGPVLNAQLSFRNKRFSLMSGFHSYYHPSYNGILQYHRVTPYLFPTNGKIQKIESRSAFIQMEINKGKVNHRVQMAGSATRDFLLTDLYGVEVPVEREWAQLSYHTDYNLRDNIIFSFNTGYSLNKAENLENKDRLWLGWDQQVVSVGSTLKHDLQNGNQQFGAKTDVYLLKDNLSGNNLKNNVSSLYHSLNVELSEKMNLGTSSQLVYSDRIALKNTASLMLKFDDIHKIEASGTYAQRLPAEDNSLWFWVAAKGFATDTLSQFGVAELPDLSIFYQTKLGWNSSYEKFDFELSVIWSKNQNEYAWRYRFVPNGNSIRAGDYEFISDLKASFFEIPFSLDYQITPRLKTAFSYTFTEKISGSDIFFSMIPVHESMLNINYKPTVSFKLWSRMRFQSKTDWNMLAPINGKVVTVRNKHDEIYSSTLNKKLIWDAGIRKGFWDQKLTISLTMKNLLNQSYRNHPISHRNTLTLFLGAHLDL